MNLENTIKVKSNGGEVWNWRSDSVRLCLRMLSAISGTIQNIWRQQRPEVQTFPGVTASTKYDIFLVGWAPDKKKPRQPLPGHSSII
ncbi:hypothetical protein A3848_04150 [Paenibacillus sp. P32E]|nr:hypothetical protein A3848_04150 [Paenibacillus sp. P32E]